MSALAVEPDEMSYPTSTTFDDDLLSHVAHTIASADEADLAASVPAGDRHPSLVDLCGKFHAIIVSEAAKTLLDDVDALPEEAGLWVAPSWAWVHSRVKVGRKERAADGSKLRLPIRVDWSEGPLYVVERDATRTIPWTAAGLGHTGADATPISATGGLLTTHVEATASGVPTSVTVPLLDRVDMTRELQGLVQAGQTARWEILSYLEPYISKALHAAHSNVANELALQWGSHQTLLDETKLEAIRNRMLLGDDEHPGKISQLLERCLLPDTFRKVEPLKYIKETLRRDANTEVRNALGDPHIGPKIRRVAREQGLTNLDDIVEAYREQYPNDRLSTDRAAAALSVAPDAMASWWGLRTEVGA